MKGPVIFAWFLSLLIAGLNSASAQNELVYVKSGGAINLKPESSGPFTSILWKHKDNLVVEWVNKDTDYYGMFVGRTALNTATGGLVIEHTNENFTGLYTVELSSKVQKKGYNVEFIKEVSKPEVDVKPLVCSSEESNSCTLVCLHYEASAYGPLTYSWREDGGAWRQGDKDKTKTINNDDKTKTIERFTCQVKNPISEAESDPRNNPFYKEQEPGSSSDTVGGVIGVLVVLLALAGVGGAWWTRKLNRWLPENLQRGGGDPPADRNGDAGNQPTVDEELLKKDANTADPSTLTDVNTVS